MKYSEAYIKPTPSIDLNFDPNADIKLSLLALHSLL